MSGQELWVIEGNGYALPVLAQEDGQGVYAVQFASVNLMEKQKTVLRERLEKGMLSKSAGTFYFTRTVFAGLARKIGDASALDPEDHLHWSNVDLTGQYQSANPDDFYTSFTARAGVPGIRSPEQAKLLFFWFCLHMLDWLLNKQRPVDLYFCTLHPFPYRADWKNVLFRHDAELPPTFVRGRRLKFCRFIPDMFRRLGEYFYSDEMLGLNDAKTGITWSLDVEYHEPWAKHVETLEARRLEARPGKEYWRGVMQNLKRRGLDAMNLYAKWLTEIRRAKPSLPLHWDNKRCEFSEDHKVYSERAQPSALSTAADLSKVGESKPANLAPEDDTLLPLPNIQ